MKKPVLAVLIVFVAVGGLFAISKTRAPKAAPPTTKEIQAAEGIPVETSVITRGDMDRTVDVTGDISALDRVTLSAKIAGRVVRVNAREGDAVSRGQNIIELDQQDLLSNLQAARSGLESAIARLSQARTSSTVTGIQTDSAIEQAQAGLEQAQARLEVVRQPSRSQERLVAENAAAEAKARLDNAKADYDRNLSLVRQGAISQSAFDVAETQYRVAQAQYKSAAERLSLIKEGGRTEEIQQAQAQVAVAKQALRAARANASQNLLRKEDIRQAQAAVKQARASVALAEQQLSYSYIKAPISGELSARSTEPGQVIAPGQALGEVVDLGSLYLKGDLSESEFVNVHKDQQVQVKIDAIANRTFGGRVAEIYPSGSTQNRNFPVRISIADDSRLVRPGMFARGTIVVGVSRGVLLVPKDAIEERKGSKMVFALGPKNKVKRHDVSVLQENGQYVQIATPNSLQVGDVVVTAGRQNLQDGSLVSVPKGK